MEGRAGEDPPRCSVGFFYQHFARGVRRVVFDGLEPTERFSESIQFEFFEYIYHHVLRKDSDWAAREWFREQFRANAHEVDQASPTIIARSAAFTFTRRLM